MLSDPFDDDGVSFRPAEGSDDMLHWKGMIHGPVDTPYEGGTFVIDIVLPPEFPFKGPHFTFETKVWNPHVCSRTGVICGNQFSAEWSPAGSFQGSLMEIQSLLGTPNPDEAADQDVAHQYKTDYRAWKRTATVWTKQFATPLPCLCADCETRKTAFAMLLHSRLGRDAHPWSQFDPDIVDKICQHDLSNSRRVPGTRWSSSCMIYRSKCFLQEYYIEYEQLIREGGDAVA